MELIRDFKELNKNDAPIAGGKGASLGEMTQAGIPVPQGFVILSSTFDQFIKDADLIQEIEALLEKVNHKEIHTVESASEQIQGLIKSVVMPESIADEIKKQFKNLNAEYVAVRSSATAEDGQEHAWAGQLDSFLNTTEKDLLEKVQHCWASLFTPRAIFYRFEKGLHTTQISVAVVVQKMVNSEISGIAFSVHPVTEDRNQLIIEAGFGLGEAIVSGQITPDSYVVEKEPRRIIDKNVNTQARALYRVQGGGNEWREISEPQSSSQVLDEAQILELSNVILGIENHYGFPCDIEWAFESGEFYVVQSRPITTLREFEVNEYKPNFQKLLSRRHSLLTDEIIATAWNDKERFEKLTGFPEYVENVEIVDGDFCFDLDWTNKIIDKYKNADLKIFWEFINNGYYHGEKVKDYSRNLKISHSKGGLINQFWESIDLLKNLLVFLPITHPPVKIIEGKVIEILKEKGVQDNELSDVLFDVSAPTKKNAPVLENEDLLNIREMYQNDKDFDINKALQGHADKYGFLGYREPFSGGYDKQFFEGKLKDQKLESKQHKVKDIKFTNNEQQYVDLLKEFVYFRTYRTEKLYESLYYLESLWRKISDEFDLDNDIDIGRYTLDEIKNLFESGDKIAETELDNRKAGHAILLHNNKLKVIFADEMFEYKKKYYPEKKLSGNQIVGTSACKGKIIGIAKIVKSSKDQDKIDIGDILITAMTTPDFLPSMNRAAAFVTDEGGITCHAAIIAREMNKPCIISTKIATQVLKDGDLVEVDANNGVVKILESAASPKQATAQTIFEKFKEATGGIEITKQEGNFSLLNYVGCLGGCFPPYSSKYYNFDFGSMVFFGEGKHGLLLFDLSKYILTTKTTFKKFIELKGDIDEINDFNLIWEETSDMYEKYSPEKIISLNKKELDLLIRKLFSLYHRLLASTVFSESLDENQMKEYFKEITGGINGFDEFFIFSSKPIFESFVLRMDQSLADKEKTTEDLQYLFSDYYITPPVYAVGEKVKELILQRGGLEKIQEEIKNIKHEISENNIIVNEYKAKLSDGKALLFDFAQKSMYIRDIRKEPLQKQLAMISNTARAIFEKNSLNPADAPYAMYNDFVSGFYNSDLYRAEIDNRKNQGFIAIFNAKETMFEYGDISEKKNIFFELIDKSAGDGLEIKGNIAYKGVIKAEVQIVLSDKDFSKFKDGNVLVTSMTRPEFVPLMKRASAVITDEGGITCHAAIVSRELKIPCIIGAKIATRKLKDGDLVEVDADKGVVRILQSAESTIKSGEINLIYGGDEWFMTITRNMSFWHQYLSNEGHYHHTNDFGVDAKLRILQITKKGTETSVFMCNPNYGEYSKAVIDAVSTKKSVDDLKKKYFELADKLVSALDEAKKNLNKSSLTTFLDEYRRFTAGLMITATLGRSGAEKLTARLKKLGHKEEEISEINAVITYPKEHTPLFNSQLDLLKIGIQVQNGEIKEEKIDDTLFGWLDKYGYIPVNFCEDPWDINDAREQLGGFLKKNCKEEYQLADNGHNMRVENAKQLLDKIGDEEVSNLAYAIAEGTYLNEFRKNIFSRVSLEYRGIFEKIALSGGSKNWRDCFYITSNEMLDIVSGKKISIPDIVSERQIVGIYINKNGGSVFLDKENNNKFFDYTARVYGAATHEQSLSDKSFKGSIANKGTVKGVAKIILGSKDFHKLNIGEILVTTMTSVDFVPVMERAAAFVTNEGGITSHASIVAREMNKPCIIGTKIATQVLKDGDLVEVDADNGIIKKIKNL